MTEYRISLGNVRKRWQIFRFFMDDSSYLNSLGLINRRDLILYLFFLNLFYLVLSWYIYSIMNLKYIIYFAIIFYVPFNVAVYKTYLFNTTSVFASKLNRDKSLFYLILSILGSRFNLERIFYIFLSSPTSRLIESTRRLVERWLASFYLTGTPIDTIIFRELEKIPEPVLRKYFKELIRINWIGGDISNYLKNALKEYYDHLRESWTTTWKNITGYLEVVILIFGLFPSLLASLLFLIGMDLTIKVFVISLVIYPFLAYFVYLFIENKNPQLPIESNRSIILKKNIALSIVIFVFSLYSLSNLFSFNLMILTSCILFSMTPITISNILLVKKLSIIESELTSLLKEIEELMKGGLSLLEAIKEIDLTKYPELLREEIRDIIVKYENGMDIRNRDREIISESLMIFRVVVGEILYSGGGLEEVLQLRGLLESYRKINSIRFSSALIPIISSIGVLLLGGYSTWTILSMISHIGSLESNILPITSSSISTISTFSKLFLLSGAVYTGLLIDKAVFGRISRLISTYFIILSVLVVLLVFHI